MSFSLPIITSHFRSVDEVIVENWSALKFSPGDFQDLAQKIIYLAKFRREADKLGFNARASVVKHFPSSSVLQKWLKATSVVLEKGRGKCSKEQI